jgi:transposase
MPKPYPQEFRDDVVRVARNREPGVTITNIGIDATRCCGNLITRISRAEEGRIFAAY